MASVDAVESQVENINQEPAAAQENDEKPKSADLESEIEQTTEMKQDEASEQEESSHPKAIGSLLRMMQSDKDNFYEEPSSSKSEVTIFMPSYVEDWQEDEEGEPVPKKKKTSEKRNDFHCTLCNVSCTSQIMMDTHLAGKKHLKKVGQMKQKTKAFPPDKLKQKNERRFHKAAKIQKQFEEISVREPVVGLEYITEYQKADANHIYFCELCELKSDAGMMLDHVINRQHRLRFMRTHCFDIYYRITGYPSFKGMMRPSEADKLLRKQSSFVVRTVLRGVVRQCKVREYKGEDSIGICNKLGKRKAGAVHPSQHKDLPRAEHLLRQGEVKEKEEKKEMAKRRTGMLSQRKKLIHPFKAGYRGSAANYRAVDAPPSRGRGILEEANHLEVRLRAERALKLNQQELRIITALKKLRETNARQGMTREEAVAGRKLKALLVNIRGEKQRNAQVGTRVDRRPHLNETRQAARHSDMQEVRLRRAHSRAEAQAPFPPARSPPREGFRRSQTAPQRHFAGRMQEPMQEPRLEELRERGRSPINNQTTLLDLRKVVEPIIEQTRQKVEQKIFQALSGGDLSSLTDMFKNNPELQETLKQWEQKQSVKSFDTDDGQTFRRDNDGQTFRRDNDGQTFRRDNDGQTFRRDNDGQTFRRDTSHQARYGGQPESAFSANSRVVEKPRLMDLAEGELASQAFGRARKRPLLTDPHASNSGPRREDMPSSFNERGDTEYDGSGWNDRRYDEPPDRVKERPIPTDRPYGGAQNRPIHSGPRGSRHGPVSAPSASYNEVRDEKEHSKFGRDDAAFGMAKEKPPLGRRQITHVPADLRVSRYSPVSGSYDEAYGDESDWNKPRGNVTYGRGRLSPSPRFQKPHSGSRQNSAAGPRGPRQHHQNSAAGPRGSRPRPKPGGLLGSRPQFSGVHSDW